jgi:hypothetical protein
MHRFDRGFLDRYREAVVDPTRGSTLARAVAAVEESGAEVGGRHYKRVPAGYDKDHERADLLLHQGLYAGLELGVPPETHTPEFQAFCAARYRAMRPVLDWLVELLDS